MTGITREMVTAEINAAVRVFIEGDSAKSVQDINEGYCADFADSVWCGLGRTNEVSFCNCYYLGCGHTWLQFAGLAFDAECPDGVDDWRNLPLWQRSAPHPDSEIHIG